MKLSTVVGIVVVVGVLFFLGIVSPAKFAKAKCRWKQRDATSTLTELHKRIATNLAKGDKAGSFGDLAWYPKTNAYEYTISIGFGASFRVEARAVDLNGDVWTIDERTTLTNKIDGCGP